MSSSVSDCRNLREQARAQNAGLEKQQEINKLHKDRDVEILCLVLSIIAILAVIGVVALIGSIGTSPWFSADSVLMAFEIAEGVLILLLLASIPTCIGRDILSKDKKIHSLEKGISS